MAFGPRIALVTCQGVLDDPEWDQDLPILLEAVECAGAKPVVARWDDPDVNWAAFDLVAIRSAWDYFWRVDEFLRWAEKCAGVTALANPVEVLRWNVDKHYLGDLFAAGVPAVETRYLAPGNTVDLPNEGEYVVKPTVGAGARYAARYRPDARDTAVRQLVRMHAEGMTAMVQPYMRSIDAKGERALHFTGGRFLHADRKNAVLAPGFPYDEKKVPHPELHPWEPTAAELAVAEQALAAVPGETELLYGRVDLVDGDDGEPRVMELELVEPHLFLYLHPASVPLFAAAIVRTAVRGAR
ncbi:RimK family alpha-L-glutamate ligase [Streptomyces sp. NPDC058653]|uniref:ATP-grasp domain-containing protein n=1 Tax=Streptomyces sp. NPDC058653 TaxID=3346576 RepID=UPI0036460EA5